MNIILSFGVTVVFLPKTSACSVSERAWAVLFFLANGDGKSYVKVIRHVRYIKLCCAPCSRNGTENYNVSGRDEQSLWNLRVCQSTTSSVILWNLQNYKCVCAALAILTTTSSIFQSLHSPTSNPTIWRGHFAQFSPKHPCWQLLFILTSSLSL